MKIFITHYSKLINRKKHMLQEFEKQNITDYEFIEQFNQEDLQECHSLLFETNFKRSMMSLIHKHIYIYSLIAENYDSALILEDDVVLSDSFTDKLNLYISQLPEDYDMLFIGDGCNLHIEQSKIIPNQFIYEKCLYPTSWGGDGATRCTDSYVVSKKCAKKLCEYIKNLSYKINLSSDWWLNVVSRDNNFKVYWAEPTIVTQGTQNGLFSSSH